MCDRPRGAVVAASVETRSKNCSRPSHARAFGYFCARYLFHERVGGAAMSAVSVIIPALNEEEPIARVVREVAATKIPADIIVVDNGSTDQTANRAREAGARVVKAPRGYGRACAAGVAALRPESEIVVFLDGDGSDCPEFMNQLVDPIVAEKYDFVIGSRTRGRREQGSMNLQQIVSGRIAGWLMSILYGVRYT